MDPKSLSNMCFAKKHKKKGLKKMQAHKAKSVSTRTKAFKAIVKPKEGELTVRQGVNCRLD